MAFEPTAAFKAGASILFNMNPEHYMEKGFWHRSVAWEGSELMEKFCEVSGMSEEMIEAQGITVVDKEPWYTDMRKAEFKMGDSRGEAALFPGFDSRWRETDPTMPSDPKERANRLENGPKNQNYSCAFDSLVCVGLLLNIGRSRIEQLGPTATAELGETSRLLRRILSGPWGLLSSPGNRTDLVTKLIEEAERRNPETFKKGEMHGYNAIATLFDHCPTLSWTDVKIKTPGNGKGQGLRLATKRSFIATLAQPATSLASKVQEHFKDRVVLDRLPPVICVQCSHPGIWEAEQQRIFDAISIKWMVSGSSQQVVSRYCCEGAVVYRASHIKVRWQRESDAKVVEMDGLNARGHVVAMDHRNLYAAHSEGDSYPALYFVLDPSTQ